MSSVIAGSIHGNPVEEGDLFYRVPYLVVSRVIARAMPFEWQERFVALMGEYCGAIGEHLAPKMPGHSWEYMVKLRGSNGRFVSDPLSENYRYQSPPAVAAMEEKFHNHNWEEAEGG